MDCSCRHGTWRPLSEGYSAVADPSSVQVASSSLLTPSTPLPSSPIQSTTPAWCAESRTPYWSIAPPTPLATDDSTATPVATDDPTPTATCDHWLWRLMNPSTKGGLKDIEGKSPRVLIAGTQPSPGNLGFRNGSLEGCRGVTIKLHNSGEAAVRVVSSDSTNTLVAFNTDIPTKYLQPLGPESRFQNVIVIEKGKMYGKPFTIMGSIEPGVWKLTATKGRNKGKVLHTTCTEHLVQYV